MNTSRVLIGTAGWSYADWQGVVYPTGSNASARLRAVAGLLDCVEIDSSFYRPPAASAAVNWLKRTSDQPGFCFLAKAWQRFTHQRDRAWLAAEYQVFTDGLQPLRQAGRLGALLFQFPWSFRNEPASRDWLARLAEAFAGWPVAIEFRHDSWEDSAVRDWMRQAGLTYCNVDQPRLNHCLGPSAHATSATGYCRLHGRNARNWFSPPTQGGGNRYDYLYDSTELGDLWRQIELLAERTERTFVILNNHLRGQAVANALQLRHLRDPSAPVLAPASLLERYPGLRGQVQAQGEQQGRLF